MNRYILLAYQSSHMLLITYLTMPLMCMTDNWKIVLAHKWHIKDHIFIPSERSLSNFVCSLVDSQSHNYWYSCSVYLFLASFCGCQFINQNSQYYEQSTTNIPQCFQLGTHAPTAGKGSSVFKQIFISPSEQALVTNCNTKPKKSCALLSYLVRAHNSQNRHTGASGRHSVYMSWKQTG